MVYPYLFLYWSPHKLPVTRKAFSWHDMSCRTVNLLGAIHGLAREIGCHSLSHERDLVPFIDPRERYGAIYWPTREIRCHLLTHERDQVPFMTHERDRVPFIDPREIGCHLLTHERDRVPFIDPRERSGAIYWPSREIGCHLLTRYWM